MKAKQISIALNFLLAVSLSASIYSVIYVIKTDAFRADDVKLLEEIAFYSIERRLSETMDLLNQEDSRFKTQSFEDIAGSDFRLLDRDYSLYRWFINSYSPNGRLVENKANRLPPYLSSEDFLRVVNKAHVRVQNIITGNSDIEIFLKPADNRNPRVKDYFSATFNYHNEASKIIEDIQWFVKAEGGDIFSPIIRDDYYHLLRKLGSARSRRGYGSYSMILSILGKDEYSPFIDHLTGNLLEGSKAAKDRFLYVLEFLNDQLKENHKDFDSELKHFYITAILNRYQISDFTQTELLNRLENKSKYLHQARIKYGYENIGSLAGIPAVNFRQLIAILIAIQISIIGITLLAKPAQSDMETVNVFGIKIGKYMGWKGSAEMTLPATLLILSPFSLMLLIIFISGFLPSYFKDPIASFPYLFDWLNGSQIFVLFATQDSAKTDYYILPILFLALLITSIAHIIRVLLHKHNPDGS